MDELRDGSYLRAVSAQSGERLCRSKPALRAPPVARFNLYMFARFVLLIVFAAAMPVIARAQPVVDQQVLVYGEDGQVCRVAGQSWDVDVGR